LNAMPHLLERRVPDYQTYEITQHRDSENVPEEVKDYRDTAMKQLAVHAGQHAFGDRVGRFFGITASVVFGLLLLSAVNTAVMAMVSVMYSMAQDRELPRGLALLNYSGVPWIPLIISCLIPIGLLAFEADVKSLSELYAIGVVGAITINVLSCAANKQLE